MPTKYKIGDRVAVYYCHPSQASTERVVGTIQHVFEGMECYPFKSDSEVVLAVEADNLKEYLPSYIHPMQCRKLKSKSKTSIPSYSLLDWVTFTRTNK